jgi:hypothetical protein
MEACMVDKKEEQTIEETRRRIKELEQQLADLEAMEKAIIDKELGKVVIPLIEEFKKLHRSAWIYETDDWKVMIRKGTGKEVDEGDTCEDKRENFISKLTSSGCEIQKVKKRIYIIDGKKINIRCRSNEKIISGDKCFWYSIDFGVLEDVDEVIYLTPNSYIKLPSNFLRKITDRMYYPRDGRPMGIFDIDWNDLSIILKDGRIDVSEYYHYLGNEKY